MLQIQNIRENPEEIINRLKKRNIDASQTIQQVLKIDKEVRAIKIQLESNQAEANKLAKEIGELFKSGKADEATALKNKTLNLKDQTKNLQDNLAEKENQLLQLLYTLPNTPSKNVSFGKSADDNDIVFEWGEITNAHEKTIPHWDLAKKYQLIDFELGVKVSGAGFPFYIDKGAKLQRALINFFLNEATNAGYKEYQAPLVVNEQSGFGTGQLPDKEGQMYHVTQDGLYLIPTAEVPITNIFRDVIIAEKELPIKCTGYTPCFRREAGSYGKDVRGLNRLHQFDKVEIVQIAHPDKSYEILEDMLSHAKSLLQKLGLKYRVLKLCGGDMGFTSALTYDLEVYSAAQKKWLEVSSVSNFETFQSNRLKLRYKDSSGKTLLPHTLNGSALALPRIVAALLENYQSNQGIYIPEALQPFTGFKIIS